MLSGKELKIKRIQLDIEAQTIAKILSVSKSHISLMEKGTRKISEVNYIKWKEYLNKKEGQ